MPTLSGEYGISESGLRELLRSEGVPLRGHAITPEDTKEAIQLYEGGLPIDQVAKQVGYSWGTIRRAILQNGVVLRTTLGLEHGERSGEDR